MNARRLRVAILSDIHADVEGTRDTYVTSEPPFRSPGFHPVADLLKYINKNNLEVDHVLCPGDISNKSSTVGKIYGWNRLNELSSAMSAKELTATPGNHDIETWSPTADPTIDLRALSPSFPSRDYALDADFWQEGFTVWESNDYRIVNLNSCHGFPRHPGVGASKADLDKYFEKLNRGTFPETIEIKLCEKLDSMEYRPVNILMCHHHPIEHQQVELFKDSYGPMLRGDELLRVLDRFPNAGRWLIVHGHKHVPLLTASGFSANAPILLCAASLGGQLWHPIVSVTRNQFHILNFELDAIAGLPGLRGTVESFVWGYGRGWYRPGADSGLPAICGFGLQHDHRDLALQVVDYLKAESREFANWGRVVTQIPILKYQGPRDFELFETSLRSFGWIIIRDPDSQNVMQIAKELT